MSSNSFMYGYANMKIRELQEKISEMEEKLHTEEATYLRRSCEICGLHEESKHITYEDDITLYVCERCAEEIITEPEKKHKYWVLPFLAGIVFSIVTVAYGFHLYLMEDPAWKFAFFGATPLLVVISGVSVMIVGNIQKKMDADEEVW